MAGGDTNDWIANNNDFVAWVVDICPSGHYLDSSLELGILARAGGFMAHARPFKIVTEESNAVEAVASVAVRGTVTDLKEKVHHVALSCFVVPGLGCHLFSVKVATKQGIIAISERSHPRLGNPAKHLPHKRVSRASSYADYPEAQLDRHAAVMRGWRLE